GLAVGDVFVRDGVQGVGRRLGALEGDHEAHVVCHGGGALLAGDAPVNKVQGGLDVLLRGHIVDAPVVLGAGAQALVLLAVHADVDGDHAEVVIAQVFDVGVGPGAILVKDGLLVDELSDGVVAGLAGQDGGVAGGIGDVQIEDLLVVVEVGALDGVGGGDAVGLVLVVDGQIGQVGLIPPVGRRIHAGGGESALDAQLVLAGLDVVGD